MSAAWDAIKIALRKKWTRVAIAASSASLLSGGNAYGEEDAGSVAAKATEQVTAKVESAKENFVAAVTEGDTDAMIALVTEFGIPLVIAIAVLFFGYMVASFIGRTSNKFVSKRVDPTLGRFTGKIAKTLTFLFIAMGLLSYYGIELTSLAAILAAAGFAIGMALAGTISNFAAGVMLQLFRPFKIGDYVIIAGTSGTVEGIDLFTTQLNTPDNRRLIVPNSEIFGTTIENATHNQYRRVDVSVGCDYSACLDETRATLEGAIKDIPNTVSEPASQVYLMDLGDSSVNWTVRIWAKPADYWAVREDVTVAVKKALDAAGIGIPFPQMDVHLSQPLADESAPTRPRRREMPMVQATMNPPARQNANI